MTIKKAPINLPETCIYKKNKYASGKYEVRVQSSEEFYKIFGDSFINPEFDSDGKFILSDFLVKFQKDNAIDAADMDKVRVSSLELNYNFEKLCDDNLIKAINPVTVVLASNLRPNGWFQSGLFSQDEESVF